MSNKFQQNQQLPQAESREVLTSTLILFKAIERVNQTVLGDGANFDQCVDAVFQMCPARVKAAITNRIREYKLTSEKPVYTTWCGVQQGTPEHPVRNKRGEVVSPVIQKFEFIDYHGLLNVIMSELEAAGIHYKMESMTYQVGSIQEKEPDIPKQSVEQAKMALQKIFDADIASGCKYTMFDLAEKLLPPVPETPVFGEEPIEEPEAV